MDCYFCDITNEYESNLVYIQMEFIRNFKWHSSSHCAELMDNKIKNHVFLCRLQIVIRKMIWKVIRVDGVNGVTFLYEVLIETALNQRRSIFQQNFSFFLSLFKQAHIKKIMSVMGAVSVWCIIFFCSFSSFFMVTGKTSSSLL